MSRGPVLRLGLTRVATLLKSLLFLLYTRKLLATLTMRSLTSLPLDDDIIDLVLTFLPNFPALGATILASKQIYNIFKIHPNSIIRAVAYNITGPALPQAMRLLRYAPPPEPNDPAPLQKIWLESDPISPITNWEAHCLVKNATIVSSLENLFSSRYKDRASQTSKLDSMESWQFRSAIYRLMLFTQFFNVDDFEYESQVENDGEERLKRKNFFSQFPNYELFAVHSVSIFLRDVAQWTEIADRSFEYSGFGDLALVQGPQKILEAYETLDTETLREITEQVEDPDDLVELFKGYLAPPLSSVFEARKTKPPATDNTHWKSILKDIQSENDTCHRCHGVYGFDLYNETNWENLRGIDSTHKWNINKYLKGNLYQSQSISDYLSSEVDSSTTSIHTRMLREIHDLRVVSYDTWDKQDWLCADCIVEILRVHLHLWLLFLKKRSGEIIPDDCWYGYNCRTQIHNIRHAIRLNHLCDPTR
ncbi:hypothetical protein BDZ94DRAFT_1257074 [Collybia nuda]|uniref:Uncharacterized protein n=1 Tax=Collybia nuda TaxID=64659 RepID=A0A9P5YA64_9AGAR|nr:hypothetical protein BDZ94DRAFT_1257074 [Collybia nuda]